MNENPNFHSFNVNALIDKHDKQLNQLSIEINGINENINLFRNLIKELTDRYEKVDDIHPISQKMDSSLASFGAMMNRFKDQQSSLIKEIGDLKHHNALVETFTSSISRKVDLIVSDTDSYKECNRVQLKNIQESQAANLASFKKLYEENLGKLKSDLTVSPSSVFQQNNDIIQKLESASLDGSNAMLKVNNMDMHIKILERKIEKLDILIKKLELQAQ